MTGAKAIKNCNTYAYSSEVRAARLWPPLASPKTKSGSSLSPLPKDPGPKGNAASLHNQVSADAGGSTA
eukprot:5246576-Pyramimonas_sp.AAC.1